MAVYSMTGYASAMAGAAAEATAPGFGDSSIDRAGAAARLGLGVELRSVNARFLDLSFRMPDELRALEPALRDLLAGAFRRGKIELRLSAREGAEAGWPSPQTEQLHRLARIESLVQGWLPTARGLSVHEVLQWCKAAAAPEKFDQAALDAARHCIDGLRASRAREGARLAGVLLERATRLRALVRDAGPLVPAAVERQRQRFLDRWREALEATGATGAIAPEAVQERALGEVASYAVRIDVAEELARLESHLDELVRLIDAGGEIGKRLDFLVQEMLREANTLGSKAASLPLTSIAVEMKVAIEQMREQVQNLE